MYHPVLTFPARTNSDAMPAFRALLITTGALTVLAACGTKGPLTMPTRPAPSTAQTAPTPAPTVPVDHSSNAAEPAR
jgi:predicted small lipoprotein YifL